jgi:ADP-dependent NAD(P)H-hydrate dehydratase / NAD(P)H-hydrate epimerase
VKPVITSKESARLDRASSISVATLMGNAGYAVACEAGVGYGDSVAILTGKGNNGGDGWVAAFHLARRGADVVVHEFGVPEPETVAAYMRDRALAAGIAVRSVDAVWTPSLVIDAVFGVGFSGDLPQSLTPWTKSSATLLSVDIPSGVHADTGTVPSTAFHADKTVTFHALKPGHLVGPGSDYCGVVAVVDIGLVGERPMWLLCDASDAPVPIRDRHAHKWSAGSVAVVGGSPGMAGAPVLAARAALAAGAGAATVVTPARTNAVVPAELLSHMIGSSDQFEPANTDAVLQLAERFDVLVLGPGAGRGSDNALEEIAALWPGPLVLDADALRAARDPTRIAARQAATILTPHAGELDALRIHPDEPADEVGQRYGAVVVAKGNPTFVHGGETWVVASGGPELATIGTGDVLAGMIGAFLSAGFDPAIAARSAAYWHGVAGARQNGVRTVTASSLIDAVGGTLAAVRSRTSE